MSLMRGKDSGKAWQPGQSGNPKGRPKSLKAAVQARVGDDGERIVDAIFKIATDARLKGHNGARVRLQAWTELRDMGWGKPTATLALEGTGAAGIVFGGRYEQGGALVASEASTVDVVAETVPAPALPAVSDAAPVAVPVVDFPVDAWTVNE